MSVKEQILKQIESMSESELTKTLLILETFKPKSEQVNLQSSDSSSRELKAAYSKLAKGRFKHFPNSSDGFAQQKQDEIYLEEKAENDSRT